MGNAASPSNTLGSCPNASQFPLKCSSEPTDGKDLRTHQLLERKQELRRLLASVPLQCPLRYVDYVDGSGIALFERVCKMDLEGVVAKHKFVPYIEDRENSSWFKILNRNYSPVRCDLKTT
jgi:hypothetical protein